MVYASSPNLYPPGSVFRRRLLALRRELFDDGELDTLALRKRNHRLVAGTDGENVGGAGGKLVAGGILEVNNLEGTDVLLAALDDTNATGVATAGDHAQGADVKLDEVGDLVGSNVKHDRVTLLDERIRVTDGAAIVQTNARHALVPELLALHLAKLVLRLDGFDAVHDEATLVVVDQAEVFVALFNGDDVCKAK